MALYHLNYNGKLSLRIIISLHNITYATHYQHVIYSLYYQLVILLLKL